MFAAVINADIKKTRRNKYNTGFLLHRGNKKI